LNILPTKETLVTIPFVRTFSLAFPEVSEQSHFEKNSFRIRKKIFVTVDEKKNRICLKLSPIDQNVFCSFNGSEVYPANGAWGKQGWTFVNLKGIKKTVIKDMITVAYCEVAPKKLSGEFKHK
jgi:hypothetical protein